LIGIGITLALVTMLEAIGAKIWPFMSTVDMRNPDAMRAAVASAPLESLLWVVAGYAVAGFVGSFLACKMSGGTLARPSAIVGIVLLVGCLVNNFSTPQPRWMSVASLLVPLPAAWLGYRMAAAGRPRRAVQA
jgi:hypothetical protein